MPDASHPGGGAALAGIAFDAFGTLFDLDGLRPRLERALGPRGMDVFSGFSARLVPWTWHATAAGRYRPMPEIAAAALAAAALEQEVELSESGAAGLAAGLTDLPPFQDAGEALAGLSGEVPLAVLSNGTSEGIRALVSGAGLEEHFDHLLAADTVARFKPAPEVYDMAAEAFDAPPASVLLVSSNDWDVAGARQAGMRGAWVSRGRPRLPFLEEQPDVVVAELAELPELVRGWRRS